MFSIPNFALRRSTRSAIIHNFYSRRLLVQQGQLANRLAATSTFRGSSSTMSTNAASNQQQSQQDSSTQKANPSPIGAETSNGDNNNNSEDHQDLDAWKHRPPYTTQRTDSSDPPFQTIWTGRCHCEKVRFQLSRPAPLKAKYCHCTTCQRLHGAPFQWASIFHKTDIHFSAGHHDLSWYDPGEKTTRHKLPCKVSCAHCRTPIMDEGRNMILLFPTLIDGISEPRAREAFKPHCHMFYSRRVVDVRDGLPKWDGLDEKSDRLDEDGDLMSPEGGEEGESAAGGGGGGGQEKGGKANVDGNGKTNAGVDQDTDMISSEKNGNKRQKVEGNGR